MFHYQRSFTLFVLSVLLLGIWGCGPEVGVDVDSGPQAEGQRPPTDEQRLASLIETLEKRPPKTDDSAGVDGRRPAAIALGRMGAAASPAIPALEKLLDDSDPKVAEAAKQALEKIR